MKTRPVPALGRNSNGCRGMPRGPSGRRLNSARRDLHASETPSAPAAPASRDLHPVWARRRRRRDVIGVYVAPTVQSAACRPAPAPLGPLRPSPARIDQQASGSPQRADSELEVRARKLAEFMQAGSPHTPRFPPAFSSLRPAPRGFALPAQESRSICLVAGMSASVAGCRPASQRRHTGLGGRSPGPRSGRRLVPGPAAKAW